MTMVDDPKRRRLVEAAEELDIPGFRIEIIGDQIVMSPIPARKHAGIIREIEKQINAVEPNGIGVGQNVTVEIEPGGQQYIPDLIGLDLERFDEDEWLTAASDTYFVVEVTSSDDGINDKDVKLKSYAWSGIPLYLLVDKKQHLCFVYSGPSGAKYRAVVEAPFGEPIRLPEPFGLDIDTTRFPK